MSSWTIARSISSSFVGFEMIPILTLAAASSTKSMADKEECQRQLIGMSEQRQL